MPKTTDAVAMPCALVEISPGCTGVYVDIGSVANTVTLPEEVVSTGSLAVFDDETHILATGHKEPFTATFNIAYSELPAEAFELVLAVWEVAGCNKELCARVTPKGSGIGNRQIVITGLLAGLKPPDFDAGAAGPAVATFSIFGNYEYDVQTS